MELSRPMSAKEVANFARLSMSRIYEAVRRNELPVHRISNRERKGRLFFKPSEIEAWLYSGATGTNNKN